METKSFETAVVSLIEKATTGIDKATDFLAAELPDVVVQLMHWYSIKSAIFFSVGVFFFFVVSSIVLYLIYKGSTDDGEYFTGAMFACLLYFAPVPLIAANMDWFQIWIAPKVWLIEYAAGMTG